MNTLPTRARRQGGFTLLEIAISSVILAGMIFVVFLLLRTGTELTADQIVQQRMAGEAQRFMDLFSSDFRGSGSTVSTTTNGGGADDWRLATGDVFYDSANVSRFTYLRFSLPTSFNVGTSTTNYDQHITYFWQVDPFETLNGVDDNHNGLIDEGVIKRTDTQGILSSTSIVLHNVTKKGLAFQYSPGADTKDDVTLYLELAGNDPKSKGVITRRIVAGVSRRGN